MAFVLFTCTCYLVYYSNCLTLVCSVKLFSVTVSGEKKIIQYVDMPESGTETSRAILDTQNIFFLDLRYIKLYRKTISFVRPIGSGLSIGQSGRIISKRPFGVE